MVPNLLVLAGTTEATALGKALAEAGLTATLSLAGRVERPVRQPLPMRIGGFGGVDGLRAFLRSERITHVVDATHPFAAQMSANAVEACAAEGVPLVALTRPAWSAGAQDRWTRVPTLEAAAEALAGPPRRVMLAVGRMHLPVFAGNPQHVYLLRLVDPPAAPPPFPSCHVEVSRGPFTAEGDRALMEAHGIEIVVSKNSGGTGARAKIDAARALGLPVIMVDRPAVPDREELSSPDEVLAWLHGSIPRGV
ncbi:cobalt-precorrin-6A reductase [Litorisediminicola beolgyonensis]|uniref:Cobalt-precorrin-6A reductase n=1 Tax=Litorisediminicola beolgyonensis TaxID=1173614 RepID=A0ABW3ZGE7_9RHOB